MLDIKFIRNNPDIVREAIKNKNVKNVDIDELLELDEKRRTLQGKIDDINQKRNQLSGQAKGEKPSAQHIEEGKKLKTQASEVESELKTIEAQFEELMMKVPNIPTEDTPIGKDESENQIIKTVGEPKKFDFEPQEHLTLGEKLGIIDVERAAKVSGTRFAYLKNEAVLLEFALVQFALKVLTAEGFIPVIPPVLLRPNITRGVGYWEAGGNEDYYLVSDPEEKREESEYKGFYLAGTAEHSIVPMHSNEILNKKELPKRYVGFSSSFRREAGGFDVLFIITTKNRSNVSFGGEGTTR